MQVFSVQRIHSVTSIVQKTLPQCWEVFTVSTFPVIPEQELSDKLLADHMNWSTFVESSPELGVITRAVLPIVLSRIIGFPYVWNTRLRNSVGSRSGVDHPRLKRESCRSAKCRLHFLNLLLASPIEIWRVCRETFWAACSRIILNFL